MKTIELLEYYFKTKEDIDNQIKDAYAMKSFNRVVTINTITKEIKNFFIELNNLYGEEMVKEALKKLEDEENE